MIDPYAYLRVLFETVTAAIPELKGGFHLSNTYGVQEINLDQLGEVFQSLKVPKEKYPLVMMTPPHSRGDHANPKEGGWERYRIIAYFAKTSYYTGQTTSDPNPRTGTSQHSVYEDWGDMKRCSQKFIRMLGESQRKQPKSFYRLPPNQILTVPFSKVGTDNASGVKIDFDIDIFTECDTTNYVIDLTQLDMDSFIIHPEHLIPK